MTGTRGYATVKRGKRPDYPTIRARSTLAQLEQATRQLYPGIAHLPAGAPIFDWRVCGCAWVDPIDPDTGRTVLQADNPRYQWSEEEAQGLKSLAGEVRRLVRLYGQGYFHAKDAFRSFPGYPDAHIFGTGRWSDTGDRLTEGAEIVREIKPPADWKFYGPQLATMTVMRHAGKDVGTWSSCCLLSGRISAEIRQVAGDAPIHPEDVYGLAAPAGRPAVSGTCWPAGTIPNDPPAADPMSEGPPMGARRSATPRGRASAAAAGAGLLAELAAGVVTGYNGNPQAPGLDQRAAATAVRQLVGWATDWGVNVAWPWRMVVTPDRYYVRNQGGGWSEVSRLSGGTDVVALVERLEPRRVSASSVEQCQAMLSPGYRPATQGASA